MRRVLTSASSVKSLLIITLRRCVRLGECLEIQNIQVSVFSPLESLQSSVHQRLSSRNRLINALNLFRQRQRTPSKGRSRSLSLYCCPKRPSPLSAVHGTVTVQQCSAIAEPRSMKAIWNEAILQLTAIHYNRNHNVLIMKMTRNKLKRCPAWAIKTDRHCGFKDGFKG